MDQRQGTEVRHLKYSDKTKLSLYLETREYPQGNFSTAQQRKNQDLNNLRKDYRSLLSGGTHFSIIAHREGEFSGFVFGQRAKAESITGQSQTEMLGWSADSFQDLQALLGFVHDSCLAPEDEYVTISSYQSQQIEEKWLSELGFRRELKRYFLTASSNDNYPPHPDFQFRRARQSEMVSIANLVSQNSPNYIPGHRLVDELKIRQNYIQRYSALKVKDPKRVPMVLIEKSTDEVAGYIILDPDREDVENGVVTLYIYDIARAAGKGQGRLSQFLISGGRNLLARMGGGILFGDISTTNKPALRSMEFIGAEVESSRWALKL